MEINQDQSKRPGRIAFRIYLGIALVFGSMIAWMAFNNAFRACPASEPCARMNKTFKLTYRAPFKSINGLSYTTDLASEVKLTSGEVLAVAVSAFDNEPWGNTLEGHQFAVSGVPVSDMSKFSILHLEFVIPQLPDEAGGRATLLFSGVARIPVIEQLSTPGKKGLGFKDELKPFSYEIPVFVQPEGAPVANRVPDESFIPFLVILVFCGWRALKARAKMVAGSSSQI